MKKRILSVLLAVVIVITLVPTMAITAFAASINDSSVFLKQQSSDTCTLCSATMMLRRRAIIDGNSNWSAITESAVKSVAWCSDGLYNNFTYSGMQVKYKKFSSTTADGKASEIQSTLSVHPEGIAMYQCGASNIWHAILITDYNTSSGVYCCADPSSAAASGRIQLSQSTLASRNGTTNQLTIIGKCEGYWYISNKSGGGSGIISDSATIPARPTVSVSGSNVTVSWNDVSNETSYDVYLLREPWGWENIAYSQSVPANTTTCTFSKVVNAGYAAFVVSRPNQNAQQSDWCWFTVNNPHTCDKAEFVYFEATHPHYNCYRCSICGQIWRDTSEPNVYANCEECLASHTCDKGSFVYFLKSHPHYNCYKCSICGNIWTDTSEPNVYELCETCNPNYKPYNDPSVFLKQQSSDTCTLCSATMMLRRRAIVDGNSNWSAITESAVKSVAWCSEGLYDNFSYSGMSVTWKRFSSSTSDGIAAELISLLQTHPEGIVVFHKTGTNGATFSHAILITDYNSTTGVFSCADPSSNAAAGRIKLSQSTLASRNNTTDQAAVIGKLRGYWYISNKSGGGSGIISEYNTTTPGKPVLIGMKDSYSTNEYVTFTWAATNNTTHYQLWIYKLGSDGVWNLLLKQDNVNSGFSILVEPGKYKAYLNSYNSNAWEDGYTDWKHTKGDDIFFTCSHPANPFTDVSENAAYYDAVLWGNSKGIVSGFTATEFRPNNTCTRAQVVTFLWRAAGSPEPTSTNNPFKDVSAVLANGKANPFYKAILWGVEKGITSGYSDGTFRPNATVTRAQFVTFLWRYEGQPTSSTALTFNDTSTIAKGYRDAVAWGVENGVIAGYGNNTFRPNATCTRWHVVLFMYRDMA